FDIVGNADAAQLAAPSRFLTPCRETGPIGESQRLVHRRKIVAAVVRDAKRIGEGLRRRRNHVAAPYCDWIKTKLIRRAIDQAFEHKYHLRSAGAAVRCRRGSVGDGAQPLEI